MQGAGHKGKTELTSRQPTACISVSQLSLWRDSDPDEVGTVASLQGPRTGTVTSLGKAGVCPRADRFHVVATWMRSLEQLFFPPPLLCFSSLYSNILSFHLEMADLTLH